PRAASAARADGPRLRPAPVAPRRRAAGPTPAPPPRGDPPPGTPEGRTPSGCPALGPVSAVRLAGGACRLLLAAATAPRLLAALGAGEAVGLGAHRLVLGELALDGAALAGHGGRGEVQVAPLRGVEALGPDLGAGGPGLRGHRVLRRRLRGVLDRNLLDLLLHLDPQVEPVADGLPPDAVHHGPEPVEALAPVPA